MSQLRTEYFGDHPLAEFQEQHNAALPLWEAGESIVPIHHSIARLHPAPDVLKWLENDIRMIDEQAEDALLLGDPDGIGENPDEFPCTPRLQAFLRLAVSEFAEVVRMHQVRDKPVKAVNAVAGPYEAYDYDFTWHVDSVDTDDMTYVATLLGEASTYSWDPVRRSDFTQLGGIGVANFLKRKATPSHTSAYDTCVVSAHHGAFTPHCAPGPAYNGQPRIRLSYFAHGVLSSPQ
jgi:hypothetical protein